MTETKKTEININNKNEINNIMSVFYNLKNKYEAKFYNENIKDIIKNKQMSKIEKRVAYSKLPKQKCVNCKRHVGSVFIIKYDNKTDMKTYIAKCGDVSNPCPLNIHFEVGTTESYDKVILEQEKRINDYKKDIIHKKNEILFGYLDESDTSMILETTVHKLKDSTNTLGFFIEKNILVNNNPSKREVLKDMIIKFGEMKMDYKKMMIEFDNTSSNIKLHTALTFYTDEMLPLLKNIQTTKYDVNLVEFDEVSMEYNLIQKPNSIYNLELSLDVDDNIKSNVIGVNKKKTIKNHDDKIKTKTRKNRRELIIVDEDEDNEDNENVEVIGVREYSNEPIINSVGEISWDNPDYERVWQSLNERYKKNLSQYPEWAKLTIAQFVSDLKNHKHKTYVNPPNLIIPAQINSDGLLDFGNDLYNDLYKSTNEWEQSILNTMRPGIKGGSESAYSNYLEVLFKEKVGFTKY